MATGLFAACRAPAPARGRREARPPAAARPPWTRKKTDLLLWLPHVRGRRRRRAGQRSSGRKRFGALGRGKQRGPHHPDHALGQLRGKIPDGFFLGRRTDVGYIWRCSTILLRWAALEPLDAYITDADRGELPLPGQEKLYQGQAIHDANSSWATRASVFQYGHSGAGGRDGGFPATWQEPGGRCRKDKEAGLPGVMPLRANGPTHGHRRAEQPVLSVPVAGGRRHLQRGRHQVALMDDAAVSRPVPVRPQVQYGVLPEESMALVGTEVRNQFVRSNIAIASMDAKSARCSRTPRRQLGFHPQPGGRTRATRIASDALIMNSVPRTGSSGRQPHQIHHQRRGHGEIPRSLLPPI